MIPQDLAGRRFLFDYGLNAKFLLNFSQTDEVEVTALAGIVYSVSAVDIFPVVAHEEAPGQYEVCWRDPIQQTELTHRVDFTSGQTSVRIEDKQLKEIRRFNGCVSSA
jgi:hypothetical protein